MMRARPASRSHAELIGNLVRRHGAEFPIPEVVRASWSRCLNDYALDPQQIKRPNSVERADLQARRERLGVLLDIARIEMEALGKLIKHSEYSIMLTDRDGVILSYVGDTGFSATARTDVSSATAAPTSRSSSSGNETTLMVKTSAANRNPTPVPTMMRLQPAGVNSTSSMNWRIEAGAA